MAQQLKCGDLATHLANERVAIAHAAAQDLNVLVMMSRSIINVSRANTIFKIMHGVPVPIA